MTLASNHLNDFLPTNLLRDLMRETRESNPDGARRIVNVASEAHRDAWICFEHVQFENGYRARQVYEQPKLANLLFTYELDRRLEAGVQPSTPVILAPSTPALTRIAGSWVRPLKFCTGCSPGVQRGCRDTRVPRLLTRRGGRERKILHRQATRYVVPSIK